MTQVTVTEEVKRKKGRPRKEPKVEEITPGEPVVEVEKKKRGRKKKEVVVEEVKQKKKRGRKAAVKFFSSSIRKKIPLTTVIQDNDNYILHLDVKENVEEQQLSYGGISDEKDNDVDTVKREIQEMLANDSTILADILENNDEENLKELYEKRIESRERQDKLLVDKLETLHKDEAFMQNLVQKSTTTKQVSDKNDNNHSCDDKQITNRKKGYFQLLHQFIENKEWLEKTNINCWWCCHSFDTIPLGMPIDYSIVLKKFRVRGVFCSFACLNAYKVDKRVQDVDYLVRFLYKKLTGEQTSMTCLETAPPRCTLKVFGGELGIEEFRSSTKEHKIYKMVEYPMFVSKDYVEEVDIANVKNANTKVFEDSVFSKVVNLDDKRVQDAKLRLSQIEKTTVTLGNTIDKFIKFG
jgi:hypothetical protein